VRKIKNKIKLIPKNKKTTFKKSQKGAVVASITLGKLGKTLLNGEFLDVWVTCNKVKSPTANPISLVIC
jgi:hypothetical protein